MPTQPNILLFLTDDHARWALSPYGNPAVRTPSLAALAARGTVFEDAYTPTPVCSPARASLMTGLMASEHGIHDFLASDPRFDDRDIFAGTPCLPALLRGAGYETGLVGKWHVGRDALPARGFESWFALDGEYPIPHDGDNGFSRNGTLERHTGNLGDILTAEALGFLKRRDAGRPFFLTIGYYATHSPWMDQPRRLVDLYADHDFAEIDTSGGCPPGIINVESLGDDPVTQASMRQQYYAAVTHIDEGIGAILARLAGDGTLEDTLVVYTADHGLSLGQHGIWGKGNATRPQNLLDDNIRVPLIAAGPGFAAGERRPGFIDHLDSFRLLLGAAGLDVAALGLKRPANEQPGRAIQFGEYGTLRMARTQTHKLLTWTTGRPPQLFAVGPGADETVPVTDAPGAAEIIARLATATEAFFSRHSRPGASGPESLKPGTYNHNQAWDPFIRR